MSIKALNWAMHQVRTDGPSAQAVLFVLADVANAEGICRHADPDYIAERSRQSRATVFRRLAELEGCGSALARFSEVLPDGRRSYEIRLKLDQQVDYDGDAVEIWRKEQRAETAESAEPPPPVEPQSQIETEVKSQIETGTVSPVRPAKSHSCDPIRSPSESKEEPPNPPSGGDLIQNPIQNLSDEAQAQLDRFKVVYPAPITNYGRVVAIWAVLTHQEREDAITGAIGYAAYLRDIERKGKTRNVQDAHRWLRDRAWMGYLATGQRATEMAKTRQVTTESPEGKVWWIIHRIAHVEPFASGGGYLLKRELTAQEMALFGAPPPSAWIFIEETQINQVGAWRSFLGKALTGKQLPELVRPIAMRRGFHAPWPWPPRKDGSIIVETSIVPGTLMTEQDVEDCAKI